MIFNLKVLKTFSFAIATLKFTIHARFFPCSNNKIYIELFYTPYFLMFRLIYGVWAFPWLNSLKWNLPSMKCHQWGCSLKSKSRIRPGSHIQTNGAGFFMIFWPSVWWRIRILDVVRMNCYSTLSWGLWTGSLCWTFLLNSR